MTFILGLTGSIGMGKSATAGFFREAGVPVHDADASVHALYAGAAAAPIEAAFPGTTRLGLVDREALGKIVLADGAALKRLEAIVHPLVRQAETDFVRKCMAAGAALIVLDVPLLLETGGDRRCDAVLVVSAPASVQKQRVLARAGMTEERFEAILAKQLPDSKKRARAHWVLDTSQGFDAARRGVQDVVRACAGRIGSAATQR
ncbi:dephospho-CoA kinase [Alsobacter metallidurans]|uniref:Dephospho-CoA kinase n=1 Tax=Alsobacter metallidurans TaxID=340221 RepID=A0A917MJX3_9HYPH|nr:dephospho-CoA kinase [Alsobacter metallidurans]GGH33671.1 dephospho-CoA kinase [Alsobacter metallidurans]